jgi:hypothetical protein
MLQSSIGRAISTADSDSGFFADGGATKFLDGEATKSDDCFTLSRELELER